MNEIINFKIIIFMKTKLLSLVALLLFGATTTIGAAVRMNADDDGTITIDWDPSATETLWKVSINLMADAGSSIQYPPTFVSKPSFKFKPAPGTTITKFTCSIYKCTSTASLDGLMIYYQSFKDLNISIPYDTVRTFPAMFAFTEVAGFPSSGQATNPCWPSISADWTISSNSITTQTANSRITLPAMTLDAEHSYAITNASFTFSAWKDSLRLYYSTTPNPTAEELTLITTLSPYSSNESNYIISKFVDASYYYEPTVLLPDNLSGDIYLTFEYRRHSSSAANASISIKNIFIEEISCSDPSSHPATSMYPMVCLFTPNLTYFPYYKTNGSSRNSFNLAKLNPCYRDASDDWWITSFVGQNGSEGYRSFMFNLRTEQSGSTFTFPTMTMHGSYTYKITQGTVTMYKNNTSLAGFKLYYAPANNPTNTTLLNTYTTQNYCTSTTNAFVDFSQTPLSFPSGLNGEYVLILETVGTFGYISVNSKTDTSHGHVTGLTISEIIPDDITLLDTEAIPSALYLKTKNYTFGRTLKAGMYNTLTLPFNFFSDQIAASDLAGTTIYQYGGTEKSGNVIDVILNPTTSMLAGVPYIVEVPAGDDIVNPTFQSVCITRMTGKTVEDDNMDLIGVLEPTLIPVGKDNLMVGENNTLFWSNTEANLNAFRAYFKLHNDQQSGAPCRFVVGRGATTGLTDAKTNVNVQKFIRNGQLYFRQDGKLYNAQGQMIK